MFLSFDYSFLGSLVTMCYYGFPYFYISLSLVRIFCCPFILYINPYDSRIQCRNHRPHIIPVYAGYMLNIFLQLQQIAIYLSASIDAHSQD